MANIIEQNGKSYLVVGDKAIPIDHFDENGKPVMTECWSEETPNANGVQDCTVHLECLQIVAEPQKLG